MPHYGFRALAVRHAPVILIVAGCGVIAALLRRLAGLEDPAVVFLVGVVSIAVARGLGPSAVVSLLSVLVYDFFFVDPLFSLTVTKPRDVVSLCVFLAAAVLTSRLAARVRDQAEAARQREARTAALTEQVIEASEDGIIVLDAESRVVHVNEVACVILQVERKEVLGRRFEELASDHLHYFRLREAVREFLAHPEREGDRLEIALFLRGRDHYYVLRPTPFHTRDGPRPGLILALQDVTYLRDQEARRENLVATLSHELRTPLTSLRMGIELLRQRVGGPKDDVKALVETAHEDALRLQDVSQQFLDLARARAMAIGVQRRALDVHDLVTRVVRLFAIQAREKGVSLEASEATLPPVMGDETKLTWALSNLLANAIRYTPAGGSVRIETSSHEHAVLVSVADTGPGIPADRQDRIFERFAQDAAAGDIGAAGLGLAIVRDIVQAHGGRIHLESALGKGTRFTLELRGE